MNVCYEINAKSFLRDQIQRGIQQPSSLPDERCVVSLGGVGTTSDVRYTLRSKPTRRNLRKSKARNQFTTRDGFDSVDWDAVSRASKTYPQQFRLWMTKHVSGCNDSGQLQVHLGRRETNLCPLCKTEIETSQHHVHCTHTDRQQIYEEDLQSLLLWMQTTTSDPYFAAAF